MEETTRSLILLAVGYGLVFAGIAGYVGLLARRTRAVETKLSKLTDLESREETAD